MKICNPPTSPFRKGGLEVVRSLEEGRKLQDDKSWQKDVFQFGF